MAQQHPFGPDAEAQVLTAIIESSDDAIVGKDLRGTILTWNRGAERMYGYSPAEIIGRSVSVLVPPDRSDEFADVMQAVARGERVEPHDTVQLTKGGHRIDVSVSVSPIRNAGGQVVGAVAMARDITAQRRAESARRRSEGRWRAIIESAVDGIIVINRHGRIESFNPAAERLFGYRADEVVGRNVSVLMPPPFASEHDHYLKRYLMTGERHIIGIGREVTACRKDGSTFPVHLSVAEVALEGETKFTGIVRDLTERVRLELKLREESGLVRLGELAAVLAHEVKNPLAAVSGAIQMLGEHLPSAEDQEIVQEVLARLESLSGLMGDLLLYARPPRPQILEIDVTGLLEGLVSFLKADPNWRDVDVAVEGAINTLPADPELLKIAFQNLLLNAAQAVSGRGRVRMRVHETNGIAHVDIVDSGGGIPAEVQSRLFTPFFTTKARGTGLGLATVRRIAEAHGGQVRILETGAHGTTVRVSLPSQAAGISTLA